MSDMKHDSGKARFDLLVPGFTEQMAKIMEFGARKYAPNSWQGVANGTDRYTAALHRHMNAWQQGEDIDKESGCSHLAHVAINAMFLFHLNRQNKSYDDDLFGGNYE